MTKTQLENEKATIIAMLANGATAKDVAAAMDVSVATLYRRIGKKTGNEGAIHKIPSPNLNKALKDLLTSIELELRRATALLAKRSVRTSRHQSCCVECHNDLIALRLFEVSNKQFSLYIRLLQNIGYFEEAKKRAKGMWGLKLLTERNAETLLLEYINALEAGESLASQAIYRKTNGRSPPPLQLHTVRHIIDVVDTDGLREISEARAEGPTEAKQANPKQKTKH